MNTINLIRILPILLLSLSVNAGFLNDIKGKIFGNDMSVFLECVDTLEKKDVGKSKAKQLCIDKYANTIDNDDWVEDNSTARKNGRVAFRFYNNSNFVIKKIEYSGWAKCEDTNACEKQWFDGVEYTDIKPNSNKSITLYGQFVIPDGVVKDDWNWTFQDSYNTTNRAFGFHLDY